ncbi:RNA-binding S4 domain-containing protein [Tianweitania sediminis]|uniref:RNA-binding S4 domain-containing protein n=1 Tax=Tianweitania sediminis TaxID=1502156 RepID=A0A8J7R0M8_9HYPH|nr:RNA-binding S4 domain-containing protein [Tianweitania sediminis]MBP0437851.1 RNA-binding S4 domain-containing protein [Tianweitania sediminis]
MSEARQRLDKWLFFARLQKSRTLAAKLVSAGKVRINREKVDNPARSIKPGDVLTITLERQVLVVRCEQPGTRRGPAVEARSLYTDLSLAKPGGDLPASSTGVNSPEHEREDGDLTDPEA